MPQGRVAVDRDHYGHVAVVRWTHCTVSIGVSSAPSDALDRQSLPRLADEAPYRAKQAGRNRVEHARAGLDAAAVEAIG